MMKAALMTAELIEPAPRTVILAELNQYASKRRFAAERET